MANCYFKCGCDEGPPHCPLTIRLLDCEGSPIEGATVTIARCAPPAGAVGPIGGTTGPDGTYTFPTTTGIRDCFTIAWDGTVGGPFLGISSSAYNCTHTEDFCYDKSVIHASVTAADDLEVTLNGGVVPTTPGDGWTSDDSSGMTFTYRLIRYCAQPSALPMNVLLDAHQAIPFPTSPDGNHKANVCATVTAACNGTASVDLTQVDFSPCHFFNYYLGINPGAGAELPYKDLPGYCGNTGCASGNKGPNYRGLSPKVIQAKFTTLAHAPTSACGDSPLFFADDEDQWITCNVVYTYNGLGQKTSAYWDSGCRGPQGNYQGLPDGGYAGGYGGCFLNQTPPYGHAASYGSTRVIVSDLGASYTRYGSDDCTYAGSCTYVDGFGAVVTAVVPACTDILSYPAGLICAPCPTSAGPFGCLGSPVDLTYTRVNSLGQADLVIQIRESC
jgi:hypothetical protein